MFWNRGGFGFGGAQGGQQPQAGGFGQWAGGMHPGMGMAGQGPQGGLAGLGANVQPPQMGAGMASAGMPPSPMQTPMTGISGTAIGGMPTPGAQPQQQPTGMAPQPNSWNGVGRFPFAGISKAATGFNR